MTYHKSRIIITLLLIFLAGGCTAIDSNVDNTAAKTITTTDLETVTIKQHASTAWVSQDFVGTYSRVFTHDKVVISVDNSVGGFDASFAGTFSSDSVDEVSPDFKVAASFSQQGAGDWWYGPKISVNWVTGNTDGLAGWYENYVVENASDSPSAMHKRLLHDWEPQNPKNQYLGDTFHDGGVYKHYLVYFNQWEQYWAVRQTYRNSGTTSIYPILKQWRVHGLPNLKVDGIKFNVETHGASKQTFVITNDCLPSSFTSPSCQ